MDATLLAQARAWQALDPDAATRAELQAFIDAGDSQSLAERFAGRLHFGTAGLRALMGAGPARMNRLVVQQTTLGLGRYVLEQSPAPPQPAVAVVGFDGRHNSRQFADDAAAVLVGLGFDVWLFNGPVPTPLVGFAVKAHKAHLGVVITASHNAAGYNGYKVYWHNGAQIVPPHDTGVAHAILAASQPATDAHLRQADGPNPGRLKSLDDTLVQAYLDAVLAQSVLQPDPAHPPLLVAYTPLHGVGGRFAQAAAGRLKNVVLRTVPEQAEPNGDFPTVRLPNPEEDGSMAQVLAFARSIDADLACAHDADADRLAVAVRRAPGDYVLLSGDALGALLAHACLQQAPQNAVVATTIVSSRLLQRMAQAHHVDYFETLTGFKWISNGGLRRQALGQRFLFAYEEALGFIFGDVVWDKDGVAALWATCLLAQNLKAQGHNLVTGLEAIWQAHGVYLSAQRTIGLDASQAQAVGAMLRRSPPTSVAGHAVTACIDLLAPANPPDACATTAHVPAAATEPSPLPKSDVLIYHLEHGGRVIVRPSGTEPKIKCYYEVFEALDSKDCVATVKRRLSAHLDALCADHIAQVRNMASAPTPQHVLTTASLTAQNR